MVTEAELKLRLAPEDHGAIRRSIALAAVRPSRLKLASVYFDTPECALAAHGLVLRLRREGRRWVQTLKTQGSNPLERFEHEMATRPRVGRPKVEMSEGAVTPRHRRPAFFMHPMLSCC